METETTPGAVTITAHDDDRKAQGPDAGMTPMGAARRIAEEVDKFFDGFGVRGKELLSPFIGRDPLFKRIEGLSNIGVFLPDIEVVRREGSFIVRADLPGIPKESVSVAVKNGALVIEGERRRVEEETGEGYYRSERSYGSFHRSIPLPKDVSGDDARATFNDGVLEVTMTAPATPESGRAIAID